MATRPDVLHSERAGASGQLIHLASYVRSIGAGESKKSSFNRMPTVVLDELRAQLDALELHEPAESPSYIVGVGNGELERLAVKPQ